MDIRLENKSTSHHQHKLDKGHPCPPSYVIRKDSRARIYSFQ